MEIKYILIGLVLLILIIFIYIILIPKIIPTEETFIINEAEDETKCKYVSSRGILKSCDIHSTKPISGIKELMNYDFSNLDDNSTIYVATSAIPDFIKLFNMNIIKKKFILVSGDATESCPNYIIDAIGEDEFKKFIENDKIIRWYAQNCTQKYPKLFKIPLGLDYHSKVGGYYKQPIENEKMMIEIKDKSLPFMKEKLNAIQIFILQLIMEDMVMIEEMQLMKYQKN
jgi:hypothetical protein